MKKKAKDTAAQIIARLEQQARELRESHADRVDDLTAQLAEAKRLHKAALAHEQTLGKSLKNVWQHVTGGDL